MADKVSMSKQFRVVAKFEDGDTRTIALDNPKAGLTKASFDSIGAAGVIVGDKAGAAFYDWDSGRYVTVEAHYLDLTPSN